MDLFAMQKKAFDEWEKNLSRYLEQTMRQPEFMKLVGRNLESTLDIQGAVRQHVQKTLKALSIPTDEELTELYRTVNNLETRLLDLEERLEDLAEAGKGTAVTVPAPAAPRKAAPTRAPAAPRKPASTKAAAPRKTSAPRKPPATRKAPAPRKGTRK